jgi:hypothetical protein
MKNLTSKELRAAPVIDTTTETEYEIRFPVPYVSHVVELCSSTLTGTWGVGKSIAVGYRGVDNVTRANDGEGDFMRDYETFVPVLDGAGAPLVITKNMQFAVAPSKSGVIVLVVTGTLTDVVVAVSPINETRTDAGVYLPALP